MPYYITDKHPECKSGWATVRKDYSIVTCHTTKKAAIDHMVAMSLGAKEPVGGTHPRDAKKKESLIESFVREAVASMTSDAPEDWNQLNERQREMAQNNAEVALEFGMFDQGSKANGAHYAPGKVNPFKASGLMCQNCVFFDEANNQCQIVAGPIDPEAICKLWVIPESKITE
jgi:hypothetical protein